MNTPRNKIILLKYVNLFSNSIRKNAYNLGKIAEFILDWVGRESEKLELEVENWICPNEDCLFVYSTSMCSRLDIPQTVNGILTCDLCGTKCTVEQAMQFKEALERSLVNRNYKATSESAQKFKNLCKEIEDIN